MGLESHLNESIRLWFNQFNFLPPIPLTAAKVDTHHSHRTFEHLLSVVAVSPHRNFVLIAHGHEDGSGLYLPLTAGTNVRAEHIFLQRLMDLDGPGSTFTTHDRHRLGIDQQGLHRLLDLMHKVRGKKIDCIEWRACNLGRNQLSLMRFREFFGARLMGAPDLHSFFGHGPALTGQRWLDTHEQAHHGRWETNKFPYSDPASKPHLVCCFALDSHNKPSGGHVAADTPSTLDAWIKKFVMAKGSNATGDMALHGLWNITKQIFLEPEDISEPLGGWGVPPPGGPLPRKLILPLTENYRKHIVYSR